MVVMFASTNKSTIVTKRRIAVEKTQWKTNIAVFNKIYHPNVDVAYNEMRLSSLDIQYNSVPPGYDLRTWSDGATKQKAKSDSTGGRHFNIIRPQLYTEMLQNAEKHGEGGSFCVKSPNGLNPTDSDFNEIWYTCYMGTHSTKSKI